MASLCSSFSTPPALRFIPGACTIRQAQSLRQAASEHSEILGQELSGDVPSGADCAGSIGPVTNTAEQCNRSLDPVVSGPLRI